jgi:hypothetical protein
MCYGSFGLQLTAHQQFSVAEQIAKGWGTPKRHMFGDLGGVRDRDYFCIQPEA